MKISIFLSSKISAFNINHDQLQSFKTNCPNFEFIKCNNKNEYFASLKDCVATITWKFKSSWYKQFPKLQYLFTPAAGNDWIEPDPEKKVSLHYGSFHGELMGESLLAMILFMNRNFSDLLACKNQFTWNRNLQSHLKPLTNQTILFLGFGNIAKKSCHYLKPFNCKIFGVKRNFKNSFDKQTGVTLIKPNDILSILPEIDHLISILPASTSTDNFLKEYHFKAMKKTAFFYNIGRGNCINDNLIDKVIKEGTITGAALDVFNNEPLQANSPLWKNKRIFISPHSSAIFSNYLNLFIDEVIPKLKALGSIK